MTMTCAWARFENALRIEEVVRHEHRLAGEHYNPCIPPVPAPPKPHRSAYVRPDTWAHAAEYATMTDPLILDKRKYL